VRCAASFNSCQAARSSSLALAAAPVAAGAGDAVSLLLRSLLPSPCDGCWRLLCELRGGPVAPRGSSAVQCHYARVSITAYTHTHLATLLLGGRAGRPCVTRDGARPPAAVGRRACRWCGAAAL
jgi:hypothetical protein